MRTTADQEALHQEINRRSAPPKLVARFFRLQMAFMRGIATQRMTAVGAADLLTEMEVVVKALEKHGD